MAPSELADELERLKTYENRGAFAKVAFFHREAIISALREREEPVKPFPKGGEADAPVELPRSFLDSDPTEAMIEAGLEFNHRHNSAENMIASFKAMLAQAEIDGLLYASQQTKPREEPCAECAAVSAAIGGPDFMDPPDGGDVPLSEQVRRMRAALREREPVAWRWRKRGTEGPWFTGTSPVEGPGAGDFYEVQPLYTAPTQEHQEEQS